MKPPAFRAGVLSGLAAAIATATLLSAGPAFAYFATTDSSHPALAIQLLRRSLFRISSPL